MTRALISRASLEKTGLFAVAAALAVLFLVPMLYTLVSALKPSADIFTVPLEWIPRRVQLSNFTRPFAELNFGVYFVNSTVVAVAVTGGTLLLCSMAGYSLAKFDYRGNQALFLLVLVTMMVPIEVLIVPLAIIVRNLGWINTYLGLIIPVIVSPFAIFWMRQFMITIPKDYSEAGRIDGVGEFRIFWSLIMPMCQPALGALAIFTFMGNWNSLIWPLIAASRTHLRTIPVGLVLFESEFSTAYGELFAMSVAAVVPTVIFFAVLRGRLITGMAMVGIKS